jgi:antitoxin Phd
MMINTDNLVSMTEANQNFSRIAKLVDKNGAAVILKNNVPRYVLLDYGQFQTSEPADDATVLNVGKSIISKHKTAFEALAK